MITRSRLALACSILLVLLALGASAGASLVSDHAVSVPAGMALESSIDHDLEYECLPEPTIELDIEAYECPKGVPYCQRDSQCADFCGPGGFEVCYRGCCSCAG